MFATFSTFGFESMTLKFFPYFRDKDKGHHNFLFWLLAIPSVLFVILGILVFCFQEFILDYFREKSPKMVEYFWYLGVIGIAQLYYILFDSYLRSLYKTVVPVLFRQVILRLLISISVILYGVGWVSFPNFVLIYVLVIASLTLLIIVYTLWLGQLHIKPQRTWRIRQLSKKVIVYGGFSFFGSVSSVIIFNIDSLMLASFEGMDAVGVYTTGFYTSTLILIPWRALLKVSGPKVADLWKQGNLPELDKLYKRVSLINFAIACFLYGMMAISMDSLFSYLPDDYAAGYAVILIIGGTRVLEMLTGLNNVILRTSKYFRIDLFVNLGSVVFAVILNMLLIPYFKIEGAAWATAIVMASFNIFRLIFLWFKFKLQPITAKIFLVAVCSILAFALQYWIHLDINVFLLAIIKGLVFGLPLIASLVYFKIIPIQILKGKFS